MVKATCNLGEIEMTVEGTGALIMTELCRIVDAVCERFTEDEEDADSFKRVMIKQVAYALLHQVGFNEKNNK